MSVGIRNHLWAATSPEVVGGKYYDPISVLGRESKIAKDENLSTGLWEWTENELELASLTLKQNMDIQPFCISSFESKVVESPNPTYITSFVNSRPSTYSFRSSASSTPRMSISMFSIHSLTNNCKKYFPGNGYPPPAV
ncbi:hypothetical protein F4825DRAFT_411823 [Nemania diffusa]|nr:hypothetical protein F4825DRAFT_411823 [Nemania diffusa]